MPQFDTTTFSPQLFWLAVTFAVLFVAMWRYALPRVSGILEARQERIDADLEKATTLKEEADKVLAEYDKALAEARDRATAAIKQANDEMAAESAKRHAAHARELAAKTEAAEQRIAAARDEALANIRIVATDTARAATGRLIAVDVPAERAQRAVDEAMRGRG